MIMCGRHKENGVWWSTRRGRRLLWRNHDSLFIALGHLRIRLMKPWIPFERKKGE